MAPPSLARLIERLDAELPQTQCTRCGFPTCADYAAAIAATDAPINRCPPGGRAGIERLAAVCARPALPLDPDCGTEGPLERAVIDEAWCIGCTRCIDACPVDCIVGAAGRMHAIIDAQCTGCALCVPACPVDCISMQARPWNGPGAPPTGRAAWSDAQARAARDRFIARQTRRARRDPRAPADEADPSQCTPMPA